MGFSPQSKDRQVRLMGDSKLPLVVYVGVNSCLSLHISPVSPVAGDLSPSVSRDQPQASNKTHG